MVCMSMCAEREKKREQEWERGIMLLIQLFFWIWNSSSQCPPHSHSSPAQATTTTSHPSNNKHRKLVSPGGMDRSWKKGKNNPWCQMVNKSLDEMLNIWQKFGQMQWIQRSKVAGPGKCDDDSSPLERGWNQWWIFYWPLHYIIIII